MFCTNCGDTLTPSNVFCSSCGQKQRPGPAGEQTVSIHQAPINKPPIDEQTVSIHQAPMHEQTVSIHQAPIREQTVSVFHQAQAPPPVNARPPAQNIRPAPMTGMIQARPITIHPKTGQHQILVIILVPIIGIALGVGGFFLFGILRQGTEDPFVTTTIPTPTPIATPVLTPTPTPTSADEPEPTPEDEPEPTPEPDPVVLTPFPGTLYRGTDNHDAVTVLQYAINDISVFYTSVRSITLVNGHFGGNTVGAIFEFQNRTGLPRTGVVDAATWYLIMERQARPPEVADPPYIPPINVEYIVISPLNLRSGPSTNHDIITMASVYTIVWATHYVGSGWMRVTFGNHSGYMYREFLLLRSIHG